ncbi:hypothetical protein TcWFU_007049 [Taenia crassiceps]|uniref:Uncharacterized protein n=1 Tax=Taenia crassiceps TaxID=6207 RepID=A0ABR4QLT5_9CEST
MGDHGDFHCSRLDPNTSQQQPVSRYFENRSLGNAALCDPSVIALPENSFSRKRHFDQPDFFEEMYIPYKRPASEEAISRGLSNLNISSPLGVQYNEMEMVSVEEPSNESDDEGDSEKGLLLPEELRRGYQQLGTGGGLPDSYLQKILTPKACLALVPYIPRPLPPTSTSDPPVNSSSDDNAVTNAKTAEFEPMECLLANQAPDLRPSPSSFASPLSLGQVGGASSQSPHVYEQLELPKESWKIPMPQ